MVILLGNAVKFTNNSGWIKLLVRFIPAAVHPEMNQILESEVNDNHSLMLRIQRPEKNPKLVVSIVDSGVGIEERRLANLFQIFGNVNQVSDYTTNGIGLGLFMCKQLVNQFDGLITVDSKVGHGSKFTFSFGLKQMRHD